MGLSRSKVYNRFRVAYEGKNKDKGTPLGRLLVKKMKEVIELIYGTTYRNEPQIDISYPYYPVVCKITEECPSMDTLWRFHNPHGDGKLYYPSDNAIFSLYKIMLKNLRVD